MIDFVEYIIGELSSKRLVKTDALDLIRQFQTAPGHDASHGAVGSLRLRNTSGFDQQSYEAIFDGDEPFLRDHVVKGHRTLPGVAYLEMVRQALVDALPDAADAVIDFRNVVWAQPIIADGLTSVTIALFPAESHERDGAIDYEIYSLAENDDGTSAERIHSQGQIVPVRDAALAPQRDVAALRARMTRGRLDAERLYAAFDHMGMDYGPAQRAVRRLHQGQDEVLAHLVLPSVWNDADRVYALHPSMMDGALQALLGFIEDIDTVPPRPRLPYALDHLRIHAPCTGEMVAWLRLRPDQHGNRRVSRIDIDLCDAEGRVCVEWRGFSSRELGAAPAASNDTAAKGVLYAAPHWEDRDAHDGDHDADHARPSSAIEHHALLCAGYANFADALEGVQGHVLSDDPEQDPALRYRKVALACFAWLRHCFEARSTDAVLLQLVVADDAAGRLLLGLTGMLRSAMLENPRLNAQIVAVAADATADELGAWLQRAARLPQDAVQRFDRDGAHQAMVWREVACHDLFETRPDDVPSAFRDDGVYVITGGLGGLGALFARDILAHSPGTRVVLTGRAASSAEIDRRVQALSLTSDADTHRVRYVQLDLDDPQNVRDCFAGIVQTHGQINGILHCAGCLRDDFILKKSVDDVLAVLAPKVAGTRHLDEATSDLDLDFMALFSGGASVTGNVGQSDYAAANGFMDRYAAHRNALVARGERRGVTRAVNWPFWREGGMTASADTLERAERIAGLHPLDTVAGLQAFHRTLAQPHDRIQVVQGDMARLRQALFATPEPLHAALTPAAAAQNHAPDDAPIATDDLREAARAFIRRELSGLLKLPANQIESDAPLEKYGINSIMMMNLTNVLEETFGSLPKTLFFEYQTLNELTEYFLGAHAEALARSLGRADTASRRDADVSREPSSPAPEAALPSSRAVRRRQRFSAVEPSARDAVRRAEPVAIIGLSGRYPGAPDLDAFWRNLRDGVDSIEEVPADRWDWRDYLSEDRTQPGHHYSKWGGFIEGVSEFDALFFNIPPVEAERIDPQERMFLEHAWMAVEDAGYTRARLQIPHAADQSAQVGVYVGVMYGEYQMFGVEASLLGNRSVTPSSYASIANRVSYFLNLHGPSIALDTMCSSSLTAIHLACQDLREGRTDLAIAGGVNVTVHPNKYLMLSSGQFIATEGRCQSFGEGGDGYIPAEGVGAVILKRLSEAERDGDHIHGVILGSALNHGGKTNGYSVPNPQAQASVIAMALQACGVDARRIGYLEAHGTGTKLGDPIEIAALTQAFRRQTADKGFCLIGSAKSNIGHAESAAGIAGLTKVLLQMKHGMVVPSLHATVLNPHIDFANTPFEVNRVLRPWTPIEVDGRPLPRLAGLSSFGAGGSNAHLIIEEYVPAASRSSRAVGPQVVVLSARTAERLEQKMRDLVAFLRVPERDIALEDLAYTLQIGREAMEERLALIVESISALTAALQTWLDDPTTTVGRHRARANAGGGALSLFNTDGELQATIDRWFQTERLDRIADIWVNGVTIDWNKAHDATQRPRLIGLPTYPFARERCWIDRPGASHRVAGSVLHPLLHTNVSDLRVQAYRSVFQGREFFLEDHRVRMSGDAAQRLVPGVAYLEMMRAAAVLAVPEWREAGLELYDIAWSRPLVVTSPTTVDVMLAPTENDDIEMSIATASEDDAVLHCSGKVRPMQVDAPARVDLARLQERLQLGILAGDDVYARYARMGVEYGRSFRCVDHLRLGAEEVLAQLRLPSAATLQATGPADDYWLHPALMDSALQSALGLLVAAGGDVDRAPLPFALRSVCILAPCASEMWAWIRYASQSGPASTVVELDIDVCNAEGDVCVAIRGLASRAAPREEARIEAVLMAVPFWEPITALPPVSKSLAEVSSALLVCDLPHIDADTVAATEDLRGLAFHASAAVSISNPADRYAQHARRLLALLKDNSGIQTSARRWLQVVVPGNEASLQMLGLDAMLRTAAMENPAIRGQIVVVPDDASAQALARHLREASALQHEPVVAFSGGAIRVRRWQELPDDIAGKGMPFEGMPLDGMSAFRDDGVYLITGGMGGLGQLFAGHILAQTSRASVVLTGRRDLDAERQQQFDALAAGTGRLHYRVLDLTADSTVRDAVAEIASSFGNLRGVLHSAGVSRDGLLPTRTVALLDEVLSPKVGGTHRLDAATADLDLDFFALFSSISGALGNVGQADYAAANGFLDQFAADRQRQVVAGLRRGRTVSINWPLWAEGGMGLNAAAIDLLWRTAGVRPLSTADGLRAFERSLLRVTEPQVLVLSGDPQRLRPLLQARSAPEIVPKTATPAIAGHEIAKETVAASPDEGSKDAQVETFLREIFSRLLKVPAHRIDTRASLEQYGIDSVIAMTLTAEIEKEVGELPKTLLFEHQTIERLARHLLVTFPQRMRELIGSTQREVPVRASISAPVVAPARSRTASVSHRFRATATRTERRVAIVGLAGRYPQAETLDLFWENLRAGRDGITEVPGDRWDHARYFDPARNQSGRTYSKWGGFLDNIGGFDARFFNVSPREAELLDPQERLFLETAWETIEDAGYSREKLAGKKIGVYVGVMWSHYELYGGEGMAGIPTSSHASIANRVSYFFDFHGPSLGLDTMCSSSLTAIHLAAEDVRNGVVEAAIAGGVNLSLHPRKYLNLSQGNFMSSDGRCRSFGAGGDGYVPGEGVGALLLKPLDDALRDGDHIYAVLEASALNHGGKTHGYTVPNPAAQASLIGTVLKAADIDPRSIGYIETHGTGTSLGDPLELAGLRQAFAEYTDDIGFCAIGSVKSNIGHLEAAAGIAAVTKTLLQLRHGELVPSLHAEPPNPHIDFATSPFRVQTQLGPWPRRDGQPRRAAVSALGAGGANAHVILTEYLQEATIRAPNADVTASAPELFLLSARDDAALVRYAARMAEFLLKDEDVALGDIAYTSRIGRTALPVRLAVLASSRKELHDKLSRWVSSQSMAAGALAASGGDDCLAGRVVDAGVGGLIPGDAGQTFLGELLDREDWRALARLWIAGAEVDWSRRSTSLAPKRVRLPTYPFERERYWIGGHLPSIPSRSAVIDATAAVRMPATTLFYRPVWTMQPLPTAPPTSGLAANMASVLLIGATPEWRQTLSDRLGGAPVVLITVGTAFEVRSLDHFVVDPGCEEDADRLVETLQTQGRMPRVIVQLHAGATQIAVDPSTIMAALDIDAHFPASLARALIAHRHSGETRFLSLVSGVDASARTPGVALGGFHASLHRENPMFRSRVVELVSATSTAFDEIEIVAAELADPVWSSEVLRFVVDEGRALRERRRWVSQANERSEANSDALKRHGVYLISGGMGALGRLFAEFLARNYQARLVLLGRSPHGEQIEAKLEGLRALGGEAIYLQAEVADFAQVEAAVHETRERFGRLDGVLHAAGIHRDSYLLKKSRADRAAVFATKILGAINLDRATGDDALEIFAMFASVAGALGNAGQTDYAYANHFLDAFAHARTAMVALGRRRGRSISVDWPLWAADGMRPHDDVVAASESVGLLPLPIDAGLDAWMRILSGTEAQTMVLHGDAQRIATALHTMIDTRSEAVASVQTSSTVNAGIADLLQCAQTYLREKIGEEIRLDPARVDANERFDAFGIDSMMVSRLNDRLMADLGELPKTLFYEYSTIVELAGYLAREAPDALSNLLTATKDARPEAVGSIREAARPAASVGVRNFDDAQARDRARATHASLAFANSSIANAPVANEQIANEQVANEPIAIVGLHGQYPRSADLDALWEHLREGHDLIDVVPANRWDAEALYDADPANAERGRIYCKWGAFLDDHDAFDAAFFRIGESEALSMDPQERLFLQSVWAALEDAGLTRYELRRRYPKGKSADVGVFVGVTSNTYHLLGAERWEHGLDSARSGSGLMDPTLSSLPWSIANRVSYVFDLQGPSLPVDTACSSSVVAIHLACESLRRAECRIAVAGGVNLYLHPSKYHGLCQRRMLAEHGRCRSYGAGDDGFVPGEGIGSLILKTLSQAIRDGDRIHGLIRASGYDHSGRSNGYSAPNTGAQVALIGDVLRRADIEADTIGYVEGHGTGTQLGDSLEVRAVSQALGASAAQSCVLGSIKANIGHTESAAGVLGVTKVLLQMRYRQMVPSIHAEPANPDIDFERTPFRILKQAEAWDVAPGQPRRALINAFGAGGVNACLILEEYVPEDAVTPARMPAEELFVLSARSYDRLRDYAEAWVARLRRESASLELPEIARLLQIGREQMTERVAVVASNPTELAERLEAWLKGEASSVYRGGKGADCTDDTVFRQDDRMLKALVQARDLHGIGRAWAAGSDVPWRQLSSVADHPSGMFPTYPFARTRYWPSVAPARAEVVAFPGRALQLHPLISHNASNLWETCYTSILSRDAFYAQHHRVHREPLLPGSAWLEIARASGSLATMSEVQRLRDVVFVRPLAFNDPVQATVTTLRIDGGELLFTIASHDPALGPVVHCEGVLECGKTPLGSSAGWEVPIAALIQQSTRRITSDDCYARFARSGIDYGPSFRTIQVLHAGEGFVLARLSLSPCGDDDEFGLHPCLIDGALQTISGFAGDDNAAAAPAFIPFAIDEIAIHGGVPMDCFAHAVESVRSASARDGIRKFDIDIATDEGVVVVSLKGLSVRSLKPQPSSAITHSSTHAA